MTASTSRPFVLLIILLAVLCLPQAAIGQAQVRIKDIARLSGNREYQLIGYGLVTGLDGTGDKAPMSLEMVRGMLQNMGMELDKNMIQSKNCAAVICTAMLPPFGRAGETFDVTISSIGDAKSLQGGVLLPVLLKGGDGKVYAVAQGHISIGGFEAATGAAGGGNRTPTQKNHLTVARVPQGAILEREIGDQFARNGRFSLMLHRKDPQLSLKVKEAIDRKYGEGWAHIANPGTVEISVPSSFRDDPVTFAAGIDHLSLSIEEPNRVVINERTGTIIVGNNVRISKVVISQGGLRIEIEDDGDDPAQQGGGAIRKAPKQGSLIGVQGETTVDDLVNALNAVGATPKDLIAIFQAIDAAGALHGELKIM